MYVCNVCVCVCVCVYVCMCIHAHARTYTINTFLTDIHHTAAAMYIRFSNVYECNIHFILRHTFYVFCVGNVKFLICHHLMSYLFNFFLYSPMEASNVGETCGCYFFCSMYCVDGVFVCSNQQICVTQHYMLVVKHHSSTAFLLTPDSFAD
jgi:hypothetical protein